jgi:hypothetical protein
MKESSTGSGQAPTKNAIGARLAREIVDCDPSILSLMVMSKNGDVLAVERSSRLREVDYADAKTLRRFGVIASVILSAAENATDLMGKTEFLIGAFREQKVLLINLHEYDVALALRLSRSANAEYVYRTIGDILATA